MSALLPFVAKTLERVVFNQLSLFLSQYNKLDAKQSGFRSGHSTETALLSVTEALRVAKADSKSSVLILLDLSAAFDTVNHQILLSTLSSLGITGIPLRWFESYLTGRSFRVAWGGEVSKAHQLVTGVPQGSVLGPLLFSTYTTSLGPIMQAHGFSYHCYADDTQLYLSFQPDDPTVAARISGCLADISAWMKEHHLQLNLAKTELLVIPATPSLQHDFSIQLGTSIITPSTSVRNLGVIFDDQLTFKEHIAKTARSCRFALHNIRKIRPFLTEHAAQLLVQALVVSRLDYCNALLAGLPSNTIKPLQMIQNAAARLVFNEPKRTHVTPLFISLHWLPVAARIKFKTLMLAYRTTTGSAPSYFHSLLRIYIPSRSLRSASERRLVVPSQRGSKSLSRTFSFTIPGWWNNLPPLSGMLDPCQSSSNNWRLISFGTTWLHPKLVPKKKKKKKKKKKPFPLSFSPSLASLYLFEQWLRLGVTSTSSVWLPLQDESLYVLPNCKSLWIKASAKWLNVNVNVNKTGKIISCHLCVLTDMDKLDIVCLVDLWTFSIIVSMPFISIIAAGYASLNSWLHLSWLKLIWLKLRVHGEHKDILKRRVTMETDAKNKHHTTSFFFGLMWFTFLVG